MQRVSTVSNDTVGTITPVRAFTAQVASGVTYEILPFDPTDMNNALQYGGRVINEHSPLSLTPDETLIVDNLLLNSDFESFAAGAFTSWSSVGVPTLTQNTSYFVHGSNAANIAGAAGAKGIKQNLLTAANGFANIDQAVNKVLSVRAWLRATDASNIRLRVTFDGSTYTSHAYHSGKDHWEGPSVHSINVRIPKDASEMTVSVEKETAVAAQCDLVVAWIDKINRYTVPTGFIFPSPTKVSQQDNVAKPGVNGNYRPLSLEHLPIPGRILRLEGQGRLTVPTTDTGTVELDETRSELLIALAAEFLLRSDRSIPGEYEIWRDKAERLKGAMGVSQNTELLTVNRHAPWKVVDEGGTSYLRLVGR